MRLEVRTKNTIEEGIRNRETIQGTEVVVYAPGNGSVYVVSFTNLSGLSPEGKDRFGLGSDGKGWLVTHVGYAPMPSMVVTDNQGGLLHWEYVREKLKVSASDAVVLAELIGFVTGRTYVPSEEFLEEIGVPKRDIQPGCEAPFR
jgi:hypothetical protein